ncbi:MAG: YcgN family cysteine cluster protein [Rhodospirillales bacterium]|jgi:hypothetical protein|nr:YcgN family cysteine cluster protein [Rhodospirillales bacterium]
MAPKSETEAHGADDAEVEPFWRAKPLEAMSAEEWERLCDGCGKCCLEKLEDWHSGELTFTNIACRLLDTRSCRCRRYAERFRFVPDCRQLTPEAVRRYRWLPSTCAYRLLAEGRELPWWHPLVSGDPQTVHIAGQSVRGRAVPAAAAGDPERHIVDWAS